MATPKAPTKKPASKPKVPAGRAMSHGSIGRSGPTAKKTGGIDVGKFASEVSSNFGKGVASVGQGLSQLGKSGPSVDVDSMFPSRKASQTVPGAMKNAPGNRAGLRRAGWGK